MKRLLCLLTLSVGLLATGNTRAQATEVGSSRRLGLGFALGSPTSLVGKYFLSHNNALDFGIGFWRYGRDDCYDGNRNYNCDRLGRVGFNVDYLWQDTLATGTANLDWHIGAGGRVWAHDDYYRNSFAMAARMPVGLDLTFARPSFLEVYFELAPALYIVPDVDLDIEAAIGVRFYF